MRALFCVIIFSLISNSLECSCPLTSVASAYCSSDWVAHVKVLYYDKVANSRPNLSSYFVEIIDVFKPFKIIPNEIFTPTLNNSCALLLQLGHEYLLSGSLENGALYSTVCNQLVDPDASGIRFHEWKNVPMKLKDLLEKYDEAFDPCYGQPSNSALKPFN